MKSIVVLEEMWAVGMHHYGQKKLHVGCLYTLKRDPDNNFDPNAIKILDHPQTITKAYISRLCAAQLSPVMKSGLAVRNQFYLKPKQDPEIRRRIPHQYCTVGFKVENGNIEALRTLLCRFGISYRIVS